jgi:hypothetical protein
MKFFPGLAVSAALVFAASAANAQMSAPYNAGKARSVSDVDGPYYGGVPPEEVPQPAPRYRYGYSYGPDRGGYAPDRGYAPEYRYGPERGYGPDRGGYGPDRGGYGPDYGYAPGPQLLSPQEVYAILRQNGFSPLGIPRQRGYTYVIAVLDRGGEDGRLTIDGRSGRIIRFVPASQWGGSYGGGAYDRMSFGHGAGMAPPVGPAGALPQTTRINAAPPPPASIPSVATRAAVPVPAQRPAVAATKPAQPVQQSAVNEAKPAAVPSRTADTVGEAKPSAPAIKPSQNMPPVQALE